MIHHMFNFMPHCWTERCTTQTTSALRTHIFSLLRVSSLGELDIHNVFGFGLTIWHIHTSLPPSSQNSLVYATVHHIDVHCTALHWEVYECFHSIIHCVTHRASSSFSFSGSNELRRVDWSWINGGESATAAERMIFFREFFLRRAVAVVQATQMNE